MNHINPDELQQILTDKGFDVAPQGTRGLTVRLNRRLAKSEVRNALPTEYSNINLQQTGHAVFIRIS